jgi:small subunit ribosomal protein S7
VSRRKKSVKRSILPDARYDSQTVSKFINALMTGGKKSTAERVFYGAMDLVEARTQQPGVNIFKQALTNLKPVVEVKSRRVGGATYQVPVEVRPERRTALAMRWLISYSRDRGEKSMAEKLAAEVIAASKGEGNAIKKKEDTHRWRKRTRRSRTTAGKRAVVAAHVQAPGFILRGLCRSAGLVRCSLLHRGLPEPLSRAGQLFEPTHLLAEGQSQELALLAAAVAFPRGQRPVDGVSHRCRRSAWPGVLRHPSGPVAVRPRV